MTFQQSRHNFLSVFDVSEGDHVWPIVALTVCASLAAYGVCVRSIPSAKNVLRDRGIYGIDINKITPEGMDRFRAERKNKVLSKFSDEFKKLLMYVTCFCVSLKNAITPLP